MHVEKKQYICNFLKTFVSNHYYNSTEYVHLGDAFKCQ